MLLQGNGRQNANLNREGFTVISEALEQTHYQRRLVFESNIHLFRFLGAFMRNTVVPLR